MQIKKKIQSLFMFFTLGIVCHAQIQIGGDIDGEFEGVEFGTSVSMPV